jgi:hypothetical protein
MDPQVYVAGRRLDVPVSSLEITYEWPAAGIGGPASAQFSVLLKPTERPGWITKGAIADIKIGPGLPHLAGSLVEPDWSNGTIAIDGAANEGATTACLTSGGATSSTPDTVIDAAIARGALTWSRPASISTTALTDGDETAKLNSVSEMLAAYAVASGSRLYVDPSRQLLKGSDPTQPEFFIIPGAGELSWTTDTQATRIVGRWVNSSGTPANTIVGSGAVERIVDLNAKGPLDSTRATAILTSILAKSSSGGWSNGLTLSAGQFLGSPSLAEIGARVGRGLMVRLNGQRDPRPDRPPVGYIDFIVERAEWHVADGTITLTPRGMVASDFASILATAGVEEAA